MLSFSFPPYVLWVSRCLRVQSGLDMPRPAYKQRKKHRPWERGVEDRMMVWMRVEVGWRAYMRERNGLDGGRWRNGNGVRMEEGEGWRPEEIGERKRSRLRGYWFLYKDPWIWCGRPWQRRSQPQETALGTDHYIITNIQTNTHRSFHWDVILFQWTADWLLL